MASGKFVLRLPPKLHETLAKQSRSQGVSLNSLCVSRLSASLGTSVQSDADEVPAWITAVKGLGLDWVGIVLFGSVARGEQTENSDMDVLIVLKTGSPIQRDLYTLWDKVLGQSVDPQVFRRLSPHFVCLPGPDETPGSLWLEVSLDAIVLSEKDLQVSKVLSRIRKDIASAVVVRHISHGHPYWVRQKGSK
jgi:uncharacterized protein